MRERCKSLPRTYITGLVGCLLVFLSSPGSGHCQATDTVWFENFESGLGEWYVDNGVWRIGSGGRAPGDSLVATAPGGNYPPWADSRMVSPYVDIPIDTPRLRFWHWFSINAAGSGDYGVVQVYDTVWHEVSLRINSLSSVWTETEVDLGDYAGKTVRLAFFFHSDGRWENPGWYVDNVSLIQGPRVFRNPETWESGLGDWYAEEGVWEIGGGSGCTSGDSIIATVSGGNYPPWADARLVSPYVDIPADNPRLRFCHMFSINGGGSSDYGVVQVYDTAWHEVSRRYVNVSAVWSHTEIELGAYAGQTVRLAFFFHSWERYESTGWYIDSIEISPRNQPPLIDCPYPTDTTLCALGSEICFEVAICGEDSVWIDGHYFDDVWPDELCFEANGTGQHSFTVIATNEFGWDTCNLVVNVTQDVPIEFDAENLIFVKPEGGPIGVDSQIVRITSPCDSGSSHWTLTVIGGDNWLSVSKTSGSNPDSVAVYASDSALDPGIYSALLVFSDDSPSEILGVVNVTLVTVPGVSVGQQRVAAGDSVKLPINLYTEEDLTGFTIPLQILTRQPEAVMLDSVELDPAIDSLTVLTDPGQPHAFIIYLTPVQPPPVPESTIITCYAHMRVAASAFTENVTIDTATLSFNSTDYSYVFYDSLEQAFVPVFNSGGIQIVGVDTSDAYCYPNPFNPDNEVIRLCYGLSTGGRVTVKIYDAGGSLVRTVIENEQRYAGDDICEEWYGKNGRGDIVANGVYFFVMESSRGERAVGKIAVLR